MKIMAGSLKKCEATYNPSVQDKNTSENPVHFQQFTCSGLAIHCPVCGAENLACRDLYILKLEAVEF